MLEFVVEILQYFRVSGKENAAIEPMNRMRMRLLRINCEILWDINNMTVAHLFTTVMRNLLKYVGLYRKIF